MDSQKDIVTFPGERWEHHWGQKNPEKWGDGQVQGVGKLGGELGSWNPPSLGECTCFDRSKDGECCHEHSPISEIVIDPDELLDSEGGSDHHEEGDENEHSNEYEPSVCNGIVSALFPVGDLLSDARHIVNLLIVVEKRWGLYRTVIIIHIYN